MLEVMAKISLHTAAPDFSLTDYQGNEARLSQFKDKKHVLLVLNRGFQ